MTHYDPRDWNHDDPDPPDGVATVLLVVLGMLLAALLVGSCTAHAAPRTLALAEGWVIVLDPPAQPRACPSWTVQPAGAAAIEAVAMRALPEQLGIVITPAAAGRIHCGGFEVVR